MFQRPDGSSQPMAQVNPMPQMVSLSYETILTTLKPLQ